MFTVGDLAIHILNDCTTHVDAGGPFGLVPRALYGGFMTPDERNMIPMQQHSLVLRSGGKTIVIDTGLGEKLNDKMRRIWRLERPQGSLVEGLARLGIAPEDVDLVIDTHLHADHCAGNTRFDDAGNIVPTFPNAEYVVQRREYEDAMQPNERTRATYYPMNYQPLLESGQMRLLEGDTQLADGVYGVVTPGHTPGHMSVRFESGGEHALFTCDMASLSVHFERLGWMTSYDVEPLITLETKRQWQQWALEHDALLIFPHDINVPAARLVQPGEGKPRLEPVPFEYS